MLKVAWLSKILSRVSDLGRGKMFINRLLHVVSSGVEGVLSKSSEEARIAFIGPPTKVLEKMLEACLSEGGLGVSVQGGETKVPVFLACDEVDYDPGEAGGQCNDSMLLDQRNRVGAGHLLILLPAKIGLNLSMQSTVSFLGCNVREGLDDQWVHNKFIQELIVPVAERHGGEASSALVALCNKAIIDSGQIPDPEGEKERPWEVIRTWCETELDPGAGNSRLFAACGVPRPCGGNRPHSAAKELGDMVARIAKEVSSLGFIGFFGEMTLRTVNRFDPSRQVEIATALSGFQEHLALVVENGPAFVEAPMFYYSPFRKISTNQELPSWWDVLDYDTWDILLAGKGSGPIEGESVTNAYLVNPLATVDDDKLQVVESFPTFHVVPNDITVPFDITVEQGSNVSLHTSHANPFVYQDGSHKRVLSPTKYSFQEGVLAPKSFTVINLQNFAPRAVLYVAELRKVFPFRCVKGETDVFSCKLQGISPGERYNLTFLHATTVTPDYEAYFIPDAQSGEPLLSKGVFVETSGVNYRLDVSETGSFYIKAIEICEKTSTEYTYIVDLHLSDIEPKGVDSEFSRLVLKNYGEKSVAISFQPKIIHELQSWILHSPLSYYPLVLGYDCQKHWRRPNWSVAPTLTGGHVISDPRPSKLEVPEEILALRQQIFWRLLEEEPYIEGISLWELGSDEGFYALVCQYLEAYLAWFERSSEEACWYEVIALIPSGPEGVLAREPDALFLPPMHPLRLAWMISAQGLLNDALGKNRPCPAAGALSPSSIPDCMSLACQGPGGQVERVPFFSVNSNNNYWSILWNGKRIEALWNENRVKDFFNDGFGLSIEGLAAGFSKSQVQKSLEELEKLRAGRPTLRVSIESDNSGDSSCNSGIMAWCDDRLGIRDPWKKAGRRELHIYDRRNDGQIPSPENLANLTVDTGGCAKWFMHEKSSSGIKVDLGIINHLGCTSPTPVQGQVTSAISLGGMVRQRVRYPLPSEGGASVFLAESRKASVKPGDDLAQLESLLTKAIIAFESSATADCITFAPNTHKLREALNNANFCAISSSMVDPATFMDSSGSTYLWDYDLPAYSDKPGETSGYFLLSAPSRSIVGTVSSALGSLAKHGEVFGEDLVKSIIREVSSRGICTIKHLAAGGASAHGELGLLMATRIIMPAQGRSLLTAMEGELINLIVPIDPYLAQVDALRKQGDHGKRRPDLLVVSMRFSGGTGRIRITPIEVKFRSGIMSPEDRVDALRQASSFAPFFHQLFNDEMAPLLWKIAGMNFLAEITSFAFRVQGNLLPSEIKGQWAHFHSQALTLILSGRANIEVDARGRAIIIDGSHESDLLDLDGDGFTETLQVNTGGAREILVEKEQKLVESICSRVQDWDLCVPIDKGPRESSIPARITGLPVPETTVPELAGETTGHPSPWECGVEALGSWTEAECFLAVWAYDYMDRDRKIVKTWLYNGISALSGRKPKAVEFKLQNVSACDPRPREKKPINEAHNFQSLLKEVFNSFMQDADKARALFTDVYGELSFDNKFPSFPDAKGKKISLQNAVLELLEQTGGECFSAPVNAGTLSPQARLFPEENLTGLLPEKFSDEQVVAEGLPMTSDGIKFKVGKSLSPFSNEEFFLHPSNTDLNQLNMGIVGDLGTGKTQLIKALIYQLSLAEVANRGVAPRFLIFDYKGDYTSEDFVSATGARVINPVNIPLNLFDISSIDQMQDANPRITRANFFVDVLRKIYGGIGPVQAHNLKQAVKNSYQSTQDKGVKAPTIASVLEEYANILGSSVDSPLSILTDIVDRALFVEDPDKAENFHEFFKGIIVVNLRALGQEDEPKNMLVVMFLNLFYDFMLRLNKKPFLGASPQLRFVDSYLLVDEADSIMKYEFPVLRNILLQGREFGVGVILASQYLSHFKAGNEDYKEPLLSWFVHKVPNITVNELKGIGLTNVGTEEHVNRIKKLNKHECLFKSLGCDGLFMRGTPFYELLNQGK